VGVVVVEGGGGCRGDIKRVINCGVFAMVEEEGIEIQS